MPNDVSSHFDVSILRLLNRFRSQVISIGVGEGLEVNR